MVSTGQHALDEEFYRLLSEGSEFLQRGALEDARSRIERALDLNPNHEQALNLLGLAHFRLGQFDHARIIFSDLVNNNPIEPSLRLNLAMVHLKTGRLDEARQELDEVLTLSPGHPRATSYMGLVLEKKGDLEGAAAFYELAGNTQRAEEIRAHRPSTSGTFPLLNLQAMMQQAREQDARQAAVAPPASSTAQPAGSAPTAPAAAAPRVAAPAPNASAQAQAASGVSLASTVPAGPAATPFSASALAASSGGVRSGLLTAPAPPTAPAAPVRPPTLAAPAGSEPPSATARTTDGSVPSGGRLAGAHLEVPAGSPRSAQTLADLEACAARPGARASWGPEALQDDKSLVAVPVETASYVRSDLTVAVSGDLTHDAVYRRYRGKRTDSLFGGAEATLVGLSGQGVALLSADKLELQWLTLRGEELYLVEPALLAFTHGLVWENGRLPSDADRDLDIVHLRGSGRLLLGTRTRLASVAVSPDAPVSVHATRLVGWTGQLVPQRSPLPGLAETARRVPVVRFEGSGLVLAF